MMTHNSSHRPLPYPASTEAGVGQRAMQLGQHSGAGQENERVRMHRRWGGGEGGGMEGEREEG